MEPNITLVKEMLIGLEDYPILKEDDSISDAVALLLSHNQGKEPATGYQEILVIDAQDRLCGRLGMADILISFFPSFSATTSNIFIGKKNIYTDLSTLMEDNFRKECRRQATRSVKSFMKSPHRAIDAATHILHAAEIMIKDKESLLPVTENNQLLGVLRLTDLFRVLGSYCTL